MQDSRSAVDDVLDRVRQRLTSANTLLVREIRRLLDLPQPDAAAAIAPLLASKDIERLRLAFSLLANVSQHLLTGEMDRSAPSFARQQTATLLANLLGDRIKALGHATKTSTQAALAKQTAYVALTGRLVRLADWTAASQAEAEQIITELERLRADEPTSYLADDIGEAIATAWAGIGDHLGDPNTLAAATDAYDRAIEAYEAAGQTAEARKVRLKLVALIRRLAVDFDETITQITAMLTAIEGQEPNLQHAQMCLELARTYAAVGDIHAARAQIEAAEADSWRCGWPPPDVEDIDGSFARWVAHAEATCDTDDNFAEALFTELTVEATALALRSQITSAESERDAYSRAVQRLAVIEQRLTDAAVAATNANAAEQAAFMTEFTGAETKAWTVLPTSTSVGRSGAVHDALDAALDIMRTEANRRQEAGASADDLLPEVERIVAQAHAHHLTATEAAALVLRAEIHLQAGRFDAATVAARAAFDLPRDPQADLTIGRNALDSMINIGIETNDPAAISAACGEAIALIERHRYNISAPYAQSAFLQQRARYYTMGIDTAWRCDDFESLVQRADAFKAAGSLRNVGAPSNLNASDLDAQFRALNEQIELARQTGNLDVVNALAERRRGIWDLLSIARARAHRADVPPTLTLAALHNALDPDEAVISWYWLTRDVLLIVALDNQRVRVAKHRIDAAERDALDEFADAIQSLQRSASWIDRVHSFSTALLPETIHPVIEGKRRLILSPHRVLHALPLHVLTWDGSPLIRRFAVSYVPNLSCLVRQHTAAPEPGVLAVGISDFAIPGERLKPLPDCVPEAESVADAWSANGAASMTLVNPQATISAIRALAANGDLARLSCLHFATHGADVRGDNPMEAHLWLRDGRLDGLEIATWQLGAELVVLSACHSGQRAITRRGTELMGDDIFGLQAALFTAGAARVLGALWPADSPTAALLMADFHRRYAAGDPPEVALQAAMLARLDNATPLTQAAYYWAPFYIAAVARPVRANP